MVIKDAHELLSFRDTLIQKKDNTPLEMEDIINQIENVCAKYEIPVGFDEYTIKHPYDERCPATRIFFPSDNFDIKVRYAKFYLQRMTLGKLVFIDFYHDNAEDRPPSELHWYSAITLAIYEAIDNLLSEEHR